MKSYIPGVRISGIASAVPARVFEFTEMSQLFGANEVSRVIRSTGIQRVRVAGTLSTGDLCAAAASSLFRSNEISPQSVDALILTTQTPDRLMPSTSVLLQERLGLSEEMVPFDINYGCSGYVFGLYLAASLIAAGNCSRVLLCTGDVTTRLLKPSDRNVRMVFGDAASASLIEKDGNGIHFLLRTDAKGADHLTAPILNGCEGQSLAGGYLHMDGAEVMGFALREVPRLVSDLLEFSICNQDDVGLYALHQANEFMLRQLRRMMSLKEIQVPINVKDYGNTGPTSIPLLLSTLGDQLHLHAKSMLCAFGVGLSYGGAVLDMRSCKVVAPVEVTAPEDQSQVVSQHCAATK